MKKYIFSFLLLLQLPQALFSQQVAVKWNTFTLQQKNDSSITLNWATNLEVNTTHFLIERSENDSNYTKIGTVNAIGNSFIQVQYSFTDKDTNLLKLPTKLNYRIQAIGSNGVFGNILKTEINHLQQVVLPWKIEAPLYPNPFNDYFRIKFANTFPYPIKLSILKPTGELVQEENLDITQNSLVEVVTLKLPAGFYYIRLQYQNAVQYLKAIKS